MNWRTWSSSAGAPKLRPSQRDDDDKKDETKDAKKEEAKAIPFGKK